jgi:hypothetical protein
LKQDLLPFGPHGVKFVAFALEHCGVCCPTGPTGVHVSVVHSLPSLQTCAPFPRQTPPWQTSSAEHGLEPAQETPSVTGW